MILIHFFSRNFGYVFVARFHMTLKIFSEDWTNSSTIIDLNFVQKQYFQKLKCNEKNELIHLYNRKKYFLSISCVQCEREIARVHTRTLFHYSLFLSRSASKIIFFL